MLHIWLAHNFSWNIHWFHRKCTAASSFFPTISAVLSALLFNYPPHLPAPRPAKEVDHAPIPAREKAPKRVLIVEVVNRVVAIA